MQAKVIFCQTCLRLSYIICPSKPITVDTANSEKKMKGKNIIEEQKYFIMNKITLGIKKRKNR